MDGINFPEKYHQGGRALNSVAAEAEILFKIPEVEAGERAKNSLSHFSTFSFPSCFVNFNFKRFHFLLFSFDL